jgi:hypothetical protein
VIPQAKRTPAAYAWTSLLAAALVLAGVLVPASASASVGVGPETRVRGFGLQDGPRVGAEGLASRTSRQAYGLWYDGLASDASNAPNSAARTGGSIRYGELDALGRPTGIEATITRDMVGTGSDAARSIRPPGFQGQAAGHARGHLLGNQLGGSGKEARNLVTIYQNPANSPVMRGFENQVRAAVESGQAVQYRVTPIYRGGNPMPVGITLQATGDKGFSLQVSVLNRQ